MMIAQEFGQNGLIKQFYRDLTEIFEKIICSTRNFNSVFKFLTKMYFFTIFKVNFNYCKSNCLNYYFLNLKFLIFFCFFI